MQIRFDKDADALYITLGEDTGIQGIIKKTERIPDCPIVLDYDKDGRLFGIEIFDLSVCTSAGFAENFLLQYVGQSPERVKG